MAENNNCGRKGWRELCAAASQEPDSDRLVSLVHQILRAFEDSDAEPDRSPAPECFPRASNDGTGRS